MGEQSDTAPRLEKQRGLQGQEGVRTFKRVSRILLGSSSVVSNAVERHYRTGVVTADT